QVTVLPAAPLLQPLDPISICGTTDSLLLVGDALGTATLWLWSSDPLFSDTLNTAPGDSTATLAPVMPGTYYVQASNPGGCIATGQVAVSSYMALAGSSPDLSNCAHDTVAITLSGIDAGSTIACSSAALVLGGQGSEQIQVCPPVP